VLERLLLVVTSTFYGCCDPRFLLLIIAITAMGFCTALVIDRDYMNRRQAVRIVNLPYDSTPSARSSAGTRC